MSVPACRSDPCLIAFTPLSERAYVPAQARASTVQEGCAAHGFGSIGKWQLPAYRQRTPVQVQHPAGQSILTGPCNPDYLLPSCRIRLSVRMLMHDARCFAALRLTYNLALGRRFGVATDVQYADIDDGFSHGGVPRFYRGALRGLRRAVQAWRAQRVEFAMHLGDIIDGCAGITEWGTLLQPPRSPPDVCPQGSTGAVSERRCCCGACISQVRMRACAWLQQPQVRHTTQRAVCVDLPRSVLELLASKCLLVPGFRRFAYPWPIQGQTDMQPGQERAISGCLATRALLKLR